MVAFLLALGLFQAERLGLKAVADSIPSAQKGSHRA
jgi:hypothetical protein